MSQDYRGHPFWLEVCQEVGLRLQRALEAPSPPGSCSGTRVARTERPTAQPDETGTYPPGIFHLTGLILLS